MKRITTSLEHDELLQEWYDDAPDRLQSEYSFPAVVEKITKYLQANHYVHTKFQNLQQIDTLWIKINDVQDQQFRLR